MGLLSDFLEFPLELKVGMAFIIVSMMAAGSYILDSFLSLSANETITIFGTGFQFWNITFNLGVFAFILGMFLCFLLISRLQSFN